MSAHILLNLLNELRKSDKMWGLPSILSLFRNEFNEFNNIGARMLDSIYHMTYKLLKIASSGLDTYYIDNQRWPRPACASTQPRQSLRCSLK